MNLILALLLTAAPSADFPIAYVRVPRYPDPKVYERWQEVIAPLACEPGSDLVLRQSDGTERVLVAAGQNAVFDPVMSLDGKWIYYSLVYDVPKAPITSGWSWSNGGQGADIYRVQVETGEIVQLTHRESTPNTTFAWKVGADRTVPEFELRPSYNTGACPLPGGRVLFTSTRNQFVNQGNRILPNLQLFVMDDDGRNVEQVGHLNLGMALHPRLLKNGRVMWSTQESQGYKSYQNWSLWDSLPDGRGWGPLFSSIDAGSVTSLHWQAELTSEDIAVGYYYNAEFGAGSLFRFPQTLPQPGGSVFGWPDKTKNPAVQGRSFAFQRAGLASITPWANFADTPAQRVDGVWYGKVAHPAPAPDNGLLLTWLQGPVHGKPVELPADQRIKPQGGVYLIADAGATPPNNPLEHLTLVVDRPEFNEIQPVAVLPYATLFGRGTLWVPPETPYLPNDGTQHPLLPQGTPFCLVGTSGVYAREDSINGKPDAFSPWQKFGSVSGRPWTNADIYSIRILTQEPTSASAKLWAAFGNERLRILGEIPLRKFHADGSVMLDAAGDPDTSFLARIPADTPYTFQLVDKDRRVLNMAQTWHQGRPGEVRHDCRGCHAHHSPGAEFAGSAASKPDYAIADFTTPGTAEVYEYNADVLPVLKARCESCHSGETAKGNFDLAAWRLTIGDSGSRFPYPDTTVPAFRSRESSLVRAAYGEDGVPEHQPIPERTTLALWVDTGRGTDFSEAAGFNLATRRAMFPQELRILPKAGIKSDDLRPTLYVNGPKVDTLTEIVFGAYDYESGLDRARTSVTADVEIAGRPAGSELVELFTERQHVWSYTLSTPLTGTSTVTVAVFDVAGNVTRTVRTYRVGGITPTPDECDELRQQVAALTQQIDDLTASGAAKDGEIQRLLGLIRDAQTELDKAE